MESIPVDRYLKFRPNTLEEVRKEFNLHKPGEMEEAVKIFEDWIQKQSHFKKKNFTKHYLEQSLILSKGSLERAKNCLDKLCTVKTLMPLIFSRHDARKEITDLSVLMTPVILPQLTKDFHRVFLFKPAPDIDTSKWFQFYNFVILMLEYIKNHDYTQGFCGILDVRDVNVVNFAMKIDVLNLRQVFSILVEGYSMRVKGVYVISESKAVNALITVMKQVVTPKVGQRIQVHKDLESVYEFVDKDIFPEDYGGKEKRFQEMHEDLVDLFSEKENVEYFKDICQPGTDEKYRDTITFNNDILGMPGSFRNLTVD